MPSPSRKPLSQLERHRLTGRRIGIAVFSTIFAGATLIWTVQILTSVWGSAPPSPDGCEVGTAKLERAVERARLAYIREAGAEDERAALSRYRSALEPEWAEKKAVEAACQRDEAGKKRLRDVIALRYAEEHAVRYESLGLAPIRRRLSGNTSPVNELKR